MRAGNCSLGGGYDDKRFERGGLGARRDGAELGKGG